jgi:drug/metabolite transporter (DMT)-like permease
MIWVILAIFATFFEAVKNIFMKKVSGSFDAYSVGLGSLLVTLPILWTAVVVSGDYTLEYQFWRHILLMLPFELAVTVLWFKAVKDSELSSAFPFIAFAPFFVAIGSFVLLDESFSSFLFAGLALLTVGGYMLNKINIGLSSFVWRGALYIFIASALWGYLIPMSKIAMSYSTAQLFPAIYFTLVTILFIPIYLYKREHPFASLYQHWWLFLGIGLFNGLFMISRWTAYNVGSVVGVTALLQLTILITVVIGGTYFKEHKLLVKVGATCLMLMGALAIILSTG